MATWHALARVQEICRSLVYQSPHFGCSNVHSSSYACICIKGFSQMRVSYWRHVPNNTCPGVGRRMIHATAFLTRNVGLGGSPFPLATAARTSQRPITLPATRVLCCATHLWRAPMTGGELWARAHEDSHMGKAHISPARPSDARMHTKPTSSKAGQGVGDAEGTSERPGHAQGTRTRLEACPGHSRATPFPIQVLAPLRFIQTSVCIEMCRFQYMY
jgi:hypothetical protein